MTRVGAETPDFLGVHYYGADEDAAIEYLEAVHGKYPALPVIVSEIASISREKEEVYACMREVADGFVSPEAQLMDKEGGFTEFDDDGAAD